MVDLLRIADVIFHSGSMAAGEIIIIAAVLFPGAGANRKHVSDSVAGAFLPDGILAGSNMV